MKKILICTLLSITIGMAGPFIMSEGNPLIKSGTTETTIKTNSTESVISNPVSSFNENITTFIHPGVYHTLNDLKTARETINTATYNKVKNDTTMTNRRMTTPPRSFNVETDKTTATAWVFDSRTILYWALRAATEQNTAYANKAVDYLDVWASNYGSSSGFNAQLYKGWVLNFIAQAVELLVHNDFNFSYPNIKLTRAEAYIDKLIQNKPANCWVGNNWTTIFLASMQSYYVVKHGLATNDSDRSTAVAGYKRWAKLNDELFMTYIYMNADGSLPQLVNYSSNFSCSNYGTLLYGQEGWKLAKNASCFTTDGMLYEYWRDLSHTAMGLAYIGVFSETAYIQGYKDYYSQYGTRLSSAMEVLYGAFNKRLLSDPKGYYLPTPCSGAYTSRTEPNVGTKENAAYNAVFLKHARRLGWNIPQTENYFSSAGYPTSIGSTKTCYDYTFKGIDVR